MTVTEWLSARREARPRRETAPMSLGTALRRVRDQADFLRAARKAREEKRRKQLEYSVSPAQTRASYRA